MVKTLDLCVKNGCDLYCTNDKDESLLYQSLIRDNKYKTLVEYIVNDIQNDPTDKKKKYLKDSLDKFKSKNIKMNPEVKEIVETINIKAIS